MNWIKVIICLMAISRPVTAQLESTELRPVSDTFVLNPGPGNTNHIDAAMYNYGGAGSRSIASPNAYAYLESGGVVIINDEPKGEFISLLKFDFSSLAGKPVSAIELDLYISNGNQAAFGIFNYIGTAGDFDLSCMSNDWIQGTGAPHETPSNSLNGINYNSLQAMFQQEPARWMDTFYYTAEYPYDSPAWYTYIFDLTNGYYSDLLSAVSNGQMVTFMLSAPEDSNVAFNFCAYVQQWPDVTNLRPEGPILTVFTEEDPCGTSLISNCYTNVSVCGQNYVGGLIGRNSASVKACYSSGSVSGDISDPNNYIGGLLGIDLCQAQNCFWDYEVSGLQDVNGAAAISTATMMQQGTFTGWDFSEEDGDPAAWKMLRPGEDYPRLTWQREFEGDIAGLYGVNWADLTAFTDCWLSAGGECYYVDIDSDGQISFIDFAMLVQDWLEGQ